MKSLLDKICIAKKEWIAQQKKKFSLKQLEAKARYMTLPRGFASALRKKQNSGKIGLIAEIKKASPSAGLLLPHFSPSQLAKSYTRAGACCLSVLTDVAFFQGADQHLVEARAASVLPVLRKDFMLDPWQIVESRSLGADCILLILAVLSDNQLRELHATARQFDMDVLLEVHDHQELERALNIPYDLIGINNRNLSTLEIDLELSRSLSKYVPRDRLIVSESGIGSAADIADIRKANINCFLVGETLLRAPDIERATKDLVA